MTSPLPPSPVPPDSVLAKYLAGEAGPADTAAVESWAADAPENSAELKRLREAWKARGPAQTWDVDRAWARVAKETAADGGVRRTAPIAPRSWTANPLLRIAAGILLVVGVSFAWRAFLADPASAAIAYSTQNGEQREIELPDGTRVTLSPATELVVADGYGRGERRIDLTGEAWFEVVHDEARPFEVYAGGTITRDIGTAFSIRALAGDTVVRLVVVEGVASLRREGTPSAEAVSLNARDIGVLGAGSTARVERNVDVQAFVAWRAGLLEFTDATFADVAAELHRWYGVTFADTTLAARRVTAPLPTNDLAESLEILSRVLGVRLERVRDSIVVR
jgi:ferric-dicitrate binding protein FerR (iron transport regulator)